LCTKEFYLFVSRKIRHLPAMFTGNSLAAGATLRLDLHHPQHQKGYQGGSGPIRLMICNIVLVCKYRYPSAAT